jgi:hypothetical protein
METKIPSSDPRVSEFQEALLSHRRVIDSLAELFEDLVGRLDAVALTRFETSINRLELVQDKFSETLGKLVK